MSVQTEIISTHAPAGGATGIQAGGAEGGVNFYSRSCGRGDLLQLRLWLRVTVFLLTPLREGRPLSLLSPTPSVTISTHAPAGGATRRPGKGIPARQNFYSRPCGRGDACLRYAVGIDKISTHAPAGGATALQARIQYGWINFYSRPCGRGDASSFVSCIRLTNFYSRPCGRGDCNFPQVRHEVLRQIAER